MIKDINKDGEKLYVVESYSGMKRFYLSDTQDEFITHLAEQEIKGNTIRIVYIILPNGEKKRVPFKSDRTYLNACKSLLKN